MPSHLDVVVDTLTPSLVDNTILHLQVDATLRRRRHHHHHHVDITTHVILALVPHTRKCHLVAELASFMKLSISDDDLWNVCPEPMYVLSPYLQFYS